MLLCVHWAKKISFAARIEKLLKVLEWIYEFFMLP